MPSPRSERGPSAVATPADAARHRHHKKEDVKRRTKSAVGTWMARHVETVEGRREGLKLIRELVCASVDEYAARRDREAAVSLEREAAALTQVPAAVAGEEGADA